MMSSKADILARLQNDVLAMQGFKPISLHDSHRIRLGTINQSFPNATFPLGAIHEFLCSSQESIAATTGFITAITGMLIRNAGMVAWISDMNTVFPPALKQFGIAPEKIIFITCKSQQEVLWTMEEALRCQRLSAVIGEVRTLSFTASRRLQLAVEKSKVTGFILHKNSKVIGTTACVARWQINPLPSEATDDLPGIGFPKWDVQLVRVRSGRPGAWQVQWEEDCLREVLAVPYLTEHEHRKAS